MFEQNREVASDLNVIGVQLAGLPVRCNGARTIKSFLEPAAHKVVLKDPAQRLVGDCRGGIQRDSIASFLPRPFAEAGREHDRAVRKGDRALYYWIYPNFMINWYEGVLDTNLVCPRGVDRTEVIFDFYFADISKQSREHNLASIDVGQRIQDEDVAICMSVQRGLTSRAYVAGRLSVRREGGEHLFHRLLYSDLKAGLDRDSIAITIRDSDE